MNAETREIDFYLPMLNLLYNNNRGMSMRELNNSIFELFIKEGHISEAQAVKQRQRCNNVASNRKNGIFQEYPMIFDLKSPNHTRRLDYHITNFGVEFYLKNKDIFEMLKTESFEAYQLAISEAFDHHVEKTRERIAKSGAKDVEKDEVKSIGVDSPIYNQPGELLLTMDTRRDVKRINDFLDTGKFEVAGRNRLTTILRSK